MRKGREQQREGNYKIIIWHVLFVVRETVQSNTPEQDRRHKINESYMKTSGRVTRVYKGETVVRSKHKYKMETVKRRIFGEGRK